MLLPFVWVARADAQEAVRVEAQFLFYGDNTEFRNPFRGGETIFGTAARLAGVADLNNRVSVTLGVFGNLRFGGDDAFELVRPVVSLTIRGAQSALVFGTLPWRRHDLAAGPDRDGPHGLLPALQRETLAFDRPYEAGLQWRWSSAALRQDLWLNWQRVNTREHRERFDAGLAAEARLAGPVWIPIQVHVVHEGGQLFAAGPVRDSLAAATGIALRGSIAPLDRTALDFVVAGARFVPDRGEPQRSRNGAGFVGRASVEEAGWHAHLLFWRGRDFITEEGDPNYLSRRRDGTLYRGTRDYAEAGLTRSFHPAPDLAVAVSARIHRVERHYEYSYRILAVAALRWPLK